jgi:hypothetical protein
LFERCEWSCELKLTGHDTVVPLASTEISLMTEVKLRHMCTFYFTNMERVK